MEIMIRLLNSLINRLMMRHESCEHIDERFKFLTCNASSNNANIMICCYGKTSVTHDWLAINPRNSYNSSSHRRLWNNLKFHNLKGFLNLTIVLSIYSLSIIFCEAKRNFYMLLKIHEFWSAGLEQRLSYRLPWQMETWSESVASQWGRGWVC